MKSIRIHLLFLFTVLLSRIGVAQQRGLMLQQQAGKYGFANHQGSLIVDFKYSEAREFKENLAAVKINDKWGFIDTTGREVIKPIYHDVTDFSEGLAGVNTFSFQMANGGIVTAVIDTTGKVITTGMFYNFSGFQNGIAHYWEGYHFSGKHIYINKQGKVIKRKKK